MLSALCFTYVSEKRRDDIPCKILGYFLFVGGIGQWLRVFALDLGDSIGFKVIRAIVFVVSYLFLLSFFKRIVHILFFRLVPKALYVLIVAGSVLLWVLYGYYGVIAALHYVFALIVGSLSALFVYKYSQKEKVVPLKIFSIFLGLHFILRGVFVPKDTILFSPYLNEETFSYFLGFPVEALLSILIFICTYLLYLSSCCISSRLKVSKATKRDIYIGHASPLIFIIILVLSWIMVNYFGECHKKKEKQVSRMALNALSHHLKSILTKTEQVADALSVSARVREVIKYNDALAKERVSVLLDRYKKAFGMDICYVLNKKGVVVAVSDRNRKNSFLGKNFSSFTYFKNAIEGKKGYSFTVDKRHHRWYFYASLPIKDRDKNIIGAAVVAKDLSELTPDFKMFDYSFLIGPEGIVFIASNEEFVFRSFYVDKTSDKSAVLSNEIGGVDFSRLLAVDYLFPQEIFLKGKSYYLIKKFVNYGGWYLVALRPITVVLITRLISLTIAMFIISLVFVFFVVIRKRTNLLENVRRAYAERKAIFDVASAVAIITTDLEGRIKIFNKGAEYILGYSAYEIKGKTICIFFSPKDSAQPANFCSLIEQARSGLLQKEEYVWYRKDGRKIIVNVSVACQRNREGKAEGFIFMATDITKRKTMEEALRREKDRAKMYFDMAGTILLVLDREGKISLINKKGCNVLGYEENSIIGKDWFDNFLPVRVREEVREVFRTLIEDEKKQPSYYENPILTKDGERIIAWHNTVIRDDKGRIIGTLSSGEDVTDRKKREKEFKRKIEELEAYHRFVVDRELRMKELKEEINNLKKLLKDNK